MIATPPCRRHVTVDCANYAANRHLEPLPRDAARGNAPHPHRRSLKAIDGNIGYGGGSRGILVVDGIGSQYSASSFVTVGLLGTGTMNIGNGGKASVYGITIGGSTGGRGTVTVDGVGSQLTTTSMLQVGNLGTGTLNISGGCGGLHRRRCVHRRRYTGGVGTVTLTGAGSTLTVSGVLNVGEMAAGTLSVQNGAVLQSAFANIGHYPYPGVTGTAVVSGTGARWTTTQDLNIVFFRSRLAAYFQRGRSPKSLCLYRERHNQRNGGRHSARNSNGRWSNSTSDTRATERSPSGAAPRSPAASAPSTLAPVPSA